MLRARRLWPDVEATGAGADVFFGSSQSDTVNGNGGNDVLIASAGADAFNGGADFDTIDYSASASAITISMAGGFGTGGLAEGDSLTGVEKVIGSNHFDTITGNDNNNELVGGGGGDILVGNGGTDTFFGGFGADTMDGGLGNDIFVLNGDAAPGESIDGGAGALDLIKTFDGGLIDFSLMNLSNVEKVEMFGQAATYRFSASDIGGAGADTLQGGAGNDTLNGGTEGDVLNGGSGADTIVYTGATARVKVALDGSFAGEGEALGDTFISIERVTGSAFGDVIRGNAANNKLLGGNGNDTLQGMDGNDNFQGGNGADALTGGLGDDSFDYTALSHLGDTIKDFSPNAAGDNDTLRFTGSVFGGLPAGALAANRFQANTSGLATTADARFIYETDTGVLRFDADGNAAGAALVVATFTGKPALTPADFTIL